jgi:hypothetical protein
MVAVIATAPVQSQDINLPQLTDSEFEGLVILFERTTCYGNCPAYRLTIHGDGRVEYVGLNFVKLTGPRQGQVARTELKKIVEQLSKADFFKIDQYTEKACSCTVCTDMPTVITEVKLKDQSHRVEHYYGCRCAPRALWDVEETIDRMVRAEQWIGDVSKQGPAATTCFSK